MRVMTQNILFGGEARFEALCQVLAAARPDVLCLQECLGWEDGVRLPQLAQALGLPADEAHVYLSPSNPRGSGRRFHLALLSRLPILTARSHTAGFGHSLLQATLALPPDDALPSAENPPKTLTVFGAHLVAGNEDQRLAETEVLLDHLNPHLHRGAPIVLLGDLNALSPEDPYPPDLDARFTRLGITKYGSPPRFDVMRRLLTAPLFDTLPQRAPNTPWATAIRGRRSPGPPSDERVETRSDYVLLSADLVEDLTDCGIVDVGTASDHHGVYADLRLRASLPRLQR